MEKYNVMTLLNEDYFDFGRMFVNSFYDVMEIDRMHTLYVFDTGLSQKNRDYLGGFPKLQVMPTSHVTKHVNLHDEDWCKNVYSKTSYLLKLVKQDNLPVLMIDSDCIMIKDFTDILPQDKDFVVCRRDAEDSFCEYIASFFAVLNVDEAEGFIQKWREEMYYGTENHKESPALSRMVQKGGYGISEIMEDIISCTKTDIGEEVYIIHMKSAGALRTVQQRINQPHLLQYRERYLTEEPLMGREAYMEKYGNGTKSTGDLAGRLTAVQRALLLQRTKRNSKTSEDAV